MQIGRSVVRGVSNSVGRWSTPQFSDLQLETTISCHEVALWRVRRYCNHVIVEGIQILGELETSRGCQDIYLYSCSYWTSRQTSLSDSHVEDVTTTTCFTSDRPRRIGSTQSQYVVAWINIMYDYESASQSNLHAQQRSQTFGCVFMSPLTNRMIVTTRTHFDWYPAHDHIIRTYPYPSRAFDLESSAWRAF